MKHLTDYITESKPKAINEYMIDEGLLLRLLGKLWGWLWGSLTEKTPKDKENTAESHPIRLKFNPEYTGKKTDGLIINPSIINKKDNDNKPVSNNKKQKVIDKQTSDITDTIEDNKDLRIKFTQPLNTIDLNGIINSINIKKPDKQAESLPSYNDGCGFWYTKNMSSNTTSNNYQYIACTADTTDAKIILAICCYNINLNKIISIEPNNVYECKKTITTCIRHILNDVMTGNNIVVTHTPQWKEDIEVYKDAGFTYDKSNNILNYKKR